MHTCRQNFSDICEQLLNDQIGLELHAFHVYLDMWAYFSLEHVALQNIANFFKKSANEEKEHASKFIEFIIKRGGKYKSTNIEKLSTPIEGLLDAFEKALELEKTVNQHLLDIHHQASIDNDGHLCDYLEEEFLDEQVNAQKELSDYITNIKRCDKGLGEYIFDKEFHS